ncbi:hypothetical protein CDO73_12745 [Saccharibacillus sp. O23]|uniref:YjgB family protein n=1 Tax=Saccharibacillus sp. O23 TaxID=2009338 RepID=UPI000B4E148E|nr:YjgB family protein [Saccharibacillus sp. O23]OWR29941.1 hypothetical protein CDO73_12745 [Saccharibacillus sp. O23]
MDILKNMQTNGLKLAMAGIVAVGSLTAATAVWPSSTHAQTATSSAAQQNGAELLKELYKPALKGHFPQANGNPVDKLVVGDTTRASAMKIYGKPSTPRTSASGYDTYKAEMGTPGYALSYDKSDVLKEIRYLGTQVERKQTIGSITMSVLQKNWYAPSSATTITSSGKKQTKLTYNRGNYKLEFVYNSPNDLDHINLSKK